MTNHIFDFLLWCLAGSVGGVFMALFSYFLDYCFWPGSIFKAYLPWLAKKLLRKRPDFEAVSKMDDQAVVDLASDIAWFKLLGGCVVCFNVWHCMVTFAIVYALMSVPLWVYIPFLTVSSFLVRKLSA